MCTISQSWGPGQRRRHSDSLRGWRVRVSNLGGVKKFSLLLTHPNQRWSQPSIPYNGCRGSFSVVKRPGCGDDHPSVPSAEVKKSKSIYLLPLHDPYRILWDDLYLYRKVDFLLFCSLFTFHYVYKVFLVHAIKAYMGRRCTAAVILNLKNTWRGLVDFKSRPPHFRYTDYATPAPHYIYRQ